MKPEIILAVIALLGYGVAWHSDRKHGGEPVRVTKKLPVDYLAVAQQGYVNGGLSLAELEESVWHVLNGGKLKRDGRPIPQVVGIQVAPDRVLLGSTNHLGRMLSDYQEGLARGRSPFTTPKMEKVSKL